MARVKNWFQTNLRENHALDDRPSARHNSDITIHLNVGSSYFKLNKIKGTLSTDTVQPFDYEVSKSYQLRLNIEN